MACFSPVASILVKAVNSGKFAYWPGLSSNLVTKHLSKSQDTAKGHLQQQQKNLWSTKKQMPTIIAQYPVPKNKLTPEPPNTPDRKARTNFVYVQVLDYTGKIYIDKTRWLPVRSSQGYQYIIICYDYGSDELLIEPIKNWSESELLCAYTAVYTSLVQWGLRLLLQKLYNEALSGLKIFMRNETVDLQLVPPYLHRRNAAERSIKTIKNHFVAGLRSTNKIFPCIYVIGHSSKIPPL